MMEEKVSQCCYQNLIQITANVLKNGFSKKIALEYDFSYNIGKDDISFSQKYDLVVSKKNGNMIFSVYLVKMVFHFTTNMILSFCQKSKDDLFPKIRLKMTFEKGNVHPRKYVFSSDWKIKDDKKVYSVKYT